MSLVTGPELDEIVRLARDWYVEMRSWLIEQLTQDYPYGSVRKSPLEQLAEYRAMQGDPQAWREMIAQLEDYYRGRPDMRERVQAAIDNYVRRMRAIEAKMQEEGGLVI